MSHFKFDIMMMVGCLLFAARLVSFWQSSSEPPIDIHVDFFPVYSTSTLITANQMNLCSNIPHLCTVSILNKATRFKDFHGSNRLTYLYLLYPRYEVYRGYIVFAFSVIMFVCLSVCLFVCKLFFSSKISQQLLGLGF